MKKPELLAPVGGEKCLYPAVQNGADSVYLGIKNFGARSFADNFDFNSLKSAVDYCHLRNVKVYITLNTIIADVEMEEAVESARKVANIGADGVIVQDVGYCKLIREFFPDLPVHISTQSAVMNSASAIMCEKMGAERVVVARELSYDELKEICRKSNIEIEMFVHGAQCYSYSGQCLMSSIYGGRSGNRGKCAGPCRLPYTIKDEKGNHIDKGYLLNPVDMCLGLDIEKVLDIGADCLKIEGRMKGGDYVAATCDIYRKALDKGENISKKGQEILQNAFSRGGFTNSLFSGKSGEMNKEKSNDDAYANQKQEILELYKDTQYSSCNNKRLSVNLHFIGQVGEKAVLKLIYNGKCFEALSENSVQKAKNAPLTKERILQQLEKTGEYPFFLESCQINISEDIFMPVGEINKMRRNVFDILCRHIIDSYARSYNKVKLKRPKKIKQEKFFTAFVLNYAQADVVQKWESIKEIYIPEDVYKPDENNKIIPAFPPIIREKSLDSYIDRLKLFKEKGVKKIYASDWGIILKAKEMGFSVVGGHDLNVFNSYGVSFWKEFGLEKVVLSPEMTAKQIEFLQNEIDVLGIIYGRIPLMKSANCPLESAGKCGKNEKNCTLTDRKGEVIPIVCQCGKNKDLPCTVYFLNSKPIYMADKLKESGLFSGQFIFTLESPRQCGEILESYHIGKPCEGDFTRGHFFRGVL
ncbi:MAG: U32 family peptidase [Clostridia bacterium]|nr:U32 family peptidase [Clostridia bacterium]